VRFLSFCPSLVILSAIATTSSAQGPGVPTAFDGHYAGTATLTSFAVYSDQACRTILSVDMMITNGQVAIHLIYFNAKNPKEGGWYRGTVNVAGEVSTSSESFPGVFTVSGIIHGKEFIGDRRQGGRSNSHSCSWRIQMERE
jgi:hypothetical protein